MLNCSTVFDKFNFLSTVMQYLNGLDSLTHSEIENQIYNLRRLKFSIPMPKNALHAKQHIYHDSNSIKNGSP